MVGVLNVALRFMLSVVLVTGLVPAVAFASSADDALQATAISDSKYAVEGSGAAAADESADSDVSFVNADAETVVATGGYGGLAWTLYSSGRLVQDGASSSTEFATSEYRDVITSVEMKNATIVPASMFKDCAKLESISAPYVRDVYRYAFQGCTSLKSVSLPLVESVAGHSFSGCTALQSLSLPLLEYAGTASYDRSDRTSADYSSSFEGCTSLSSVSFPKVTVLGYRTFKGCTSLVSVDLPVATHIMGQVFANCSSLESLILPKVTFIAGAVFSGCALLKDLSLPLASRFDTMSYYYSTYSSLQPSQIMGCDSLETVSSPKSTYISDGLLQGREGLISVDFPNATGIGVSAFEGCTSLATVNIPKVTSVSSAAFKGCTALSKIDLSLVKTIGASAFEGCTRLSNVTMASSMSGATIGSSAFKGCTKLASVSLPSGLASVSSSTFEGCTALANVSLPSTVKTIGDRAFAGCSKLASISLPTGLTSIGSEAFSGSGLESVDVPSGALTIGLSAFAGCANLADVSLPDALETIPSSLFKGCTSLAEVSLPSSVMVLSSSCFEGSGLTTVTLPESVTSIANKAFGSCASLDSVRFEGDPPNILTTAFAGTTASCFYPYDNEEWDDSYFLDYGGSLTWNPSGGMGDYSATIENAVYTGKANAPTVTVASHTGDVLSPSAYTVSYYSDSACTNQLSANEVVNAGTYYLTITGNSSLGYPGTIGPRSFKIEKAVLTATYAGETISAGATPVLKVSVTGFVGGESAATAAGYVAPKVSAPNPLGFNTPHVLTPSGGAADNYSFKYVSGTLTVQSIVVEKPAATTQFVYDGTSKTAMTAGSGYSLSGHVATNAGSYTATATLLEGYVWSDGTTDDVTLNWAISRANLSAVTFAPIPDQGYTGSSVVPAISATFNGVELVPGVDFSLTYSNNVELGTANVLVEGMGNFTGEMSMTFNIVHAIIAQGEVGQCVWKLDSNGVLTISPGVRGGAMADYRASYSMPWKSYIGEVTSVVFEEGVTHVGAYSFYGHDCLESVSFADTIESIGEHAFSGCTSLEGAAIPEGCLSIGPYAFNGCSSLKSVNIPEGCLSIGGSAFAACSSLESVVIPKSVQSIGAQAFYYCESLESIEVAEGNEYYSSVDGVLFDASKGTLLCCPSGKTGSFSIPEGCLVIADCAFYACAGLTEVEISSSLTSIGASAFSGCESLTRMVRPSNLASIGTEAFA